jgi:acyl carrier protein
VTGRIKDLIITAGRNIYPQDIEAIVNDLPETADGRCVAFGIPDDAKGTEQVVILAELHPHTTMSERKASQLIAKAVATRFDISIADVRIVEAGWLKKSTSGKIARGQNRDRYLELQTRTAGPRPVDTNSTEDLVRGCVYEASGIWVENPDEPLITAGTVDSLALTNLLFDLEDKFKKRLPTPEEAGFNAYDSIRAITTLVSGTYSAPPASTAPMSELVIDRQVKANYVAEGSRDFDSLILGSSRSYLIRAQRAALHGLKAFQFTVAGARIEEMYCMARYLLNMNKTPLKHIIVGTDPIQFSPQLPIDCRFVRTHSLFPLLEENDRNGTGGLKLEEAGVDAKTDEFARKTRIYYNAWDLDLAFDPKSGDVIKLFGKRIAELRTLSYSASDTHIKWPGQFLIAKDLTHLHPSRVHYLEKLINISSEAGCRITFYTNPLHPSMVSLLKDQTPYLETQTALVEYIRSRASRNIDVHHFTVPEDFGGVNDDYYDGVHMGRTNGDVLLDYIMTATGRNTT